MELAGKTARRMLRVSSTGQDEDGQDKPTLDYVLSMGMTDAGVYRLHGKSARKGQQLPAVARAIADYGDGLYDVLVVRAIDRLDRRGAMAGWRLIGELQEAGVTVLSVADPELARAAEDAMAEMAIGIKLSMARLEVDARTRRINDTFRKMDDGGWFRGVPPLGYTVAGPKYAKALVPAQSRVEVQRKRGPRGSGRPFVTVTLPSADDVRQAFTDATGPDGEGTVALGTRLGITADAVGKMLRNPVYSTGRYEVRRSDGVTAIKRTEPLVTPAVQAAAIASLDARRTGDNVTSRAIAKDDYSGALFCPCGHHTGMHRYSGGGKRRKDGTMGPRVRRYHCGGCGKSVAADAADAAVESLMSSRRDWWLDRWHVPGSDSADALDRVGLELRELPARGLDRGAEQAERDRLWAEEDRLKALPGTPSRWEQGFRRDDGGNLLTEGDHWLSLDSAGRRGLLLRGSLRVFASARPGRRGEVDVELVFLEDGGIDVRAWDDEVHGEFAAAG
jgi:DNA invertase Pin-like site-specific DNA recombinase